MNATVYMTNGTTCRLKLPDPIWTGRLETGTGRGIINVFIGQESKRVIVESYSQWQGEKSSCLTEYSKDELPYLAEQIPELESIIDEILNPEAL